MDAIALIIGLAGVAVGIYSYAKSRRFKRLLLSTPVNTPLYVEDARAHQITVQFEEERVDEPTVLTARLENVGTEPIEPIDFQKPLIVRSRLKGADGQKYAKVLTYYVYRSTPAMEVESELVDGCAVKIEPFLMNPGEALEVRSIVDGLVDDVELAYRISGLARHHSEVSDSRKLLLSEFFDAASRTFAYGYLFIAGVVFQLVYGVAPAIGQYIESLASVPAENGPDDVLTRVTVGAAVFVIFLPLAAWYVKHVAVGLYRMLQSEVQHNKAA